jgi:EpsI family protein
MWRSRLDARSMTLRLLVVSALLVATARYLAAAARPDQIPPRDPLALFPQTIGDWTGFPVPDFDSEVLDVLGVDDYVTRTYYESAAGAQSTAAASPPVGVYIGYYESQRQGDTIHSPMNCLPGAGWQPMSTVAKTFDTSRGPVTVNRVIIQKGEERQAVLYWYQGRGRAVGNEYWSRAYLVWDAATRNRTDGALVRVISPVLRLESSDGPAESRAVRFAQQMYPHLSRHIPD